MGLLEGTLGGGGVGLGGGIVPRVDELGGGRADGGRQKGEERGGKSSWRAGPIPDEGAPGGGVRQTEIGGLGRGEWMAVSGPKVRGGVGAGGAGWARGSGADAPGLRGFDATRAGGVVGGVGFDLRGGCLRLPPGPTSV